MAQTNSYGIANDSGAVVRGRINEVFSAVQSSNSGATAPTNTAPGMLWLDTSVPPGVLKRRNSANTAWLSVDEQVPDPQDDTDTNAYLWPVGDVQDAVIVESDENANGHYVKYADGTLVCYKERIETIGQSTQNTEAIWTYPSSFISRPALNILIQEDDIVSASVTNINYGQTTRQGNESASIRVRGQSSGVFTVGTTRIFCSVIAFGRWK